VLATRRGVFSLFGPTSTSGPGSAWARFYGLRVARQVKLKPGIWPFIELSIWCPEAFSASSSGSFREPSVLLGGPAPTVRIAEARRLH
jgi:hypothetical protein